MLYCLLFFERAVEKMFELIFEVLICLIMALTYTVIISNIAYKKPSKKNFFIGGLANFFTIFILYNIKNEMLAIPVMTIILIVYLYILSKKIYSSIVIAIFSSSTYLVSNVIVNFFIVNMLNVKYVVLENKNIYILVAVIILFVSFFISKVINYILNKIYGDNYSLNEYLKSDVPTMLCIILEIVAIYTNVIMQKKYFSNVSEFVMLLNLLLTVGFFSMSVLLVYLSNKNIKDKLNQKYKDKEYKQLKEYTDMIEARSKELRGFKHDYKNILLVLGSYIKDEDIVGLKEFYNKDLLPESNKIINSHKDFGALQHIKISGLKGLISSKAIIAQDNGIQINIDISEDIFALSIRKIDISRIIGILFDNAIESALMCKVKKINFGLVKNEGSTVLSISNSCTEDTPSIHQMYEKHFSTKGDGRGIGLKTIRKIISEKYKNIIFNTRMKDCIFTQELVIYDIKKDK